MNPFVFFVGCPRSGTTLLSRIGDAHPELAIIRELHWLPRWWERRRHLTQEGMVTPELLVRLRRHPRFSRLELDPADVDALLGDGRPKHYARFVTELFDLSMVASKERSMSARRHPSTSARFRRCTRSGPTPRSST